MHRYYIYILTIILLLLGVINTANADGNTANADGNTILVATHTFWFRGGKVLPWFGKQLSERFLRDFGCPMELC